MQNIALFPLIISILVEDIKLPTPTMTADFHFLEIAYFFEGAKSLMEDQVASTVDNVDSYTMLILIESPVLVV